MLAWNGESSLGTQNIQSMDDTRDVAENREQDVDEEIGIATSLKEDTKRREDDGKDDLADVAGTAVSAFPGRAGGR